MCQQDCINYAGGYSCSCYHGYKAIVEDASECADVDECIGMPEECHRCVNFAGG